MVRYVLVFTEQSKLLQLQLYSLIHGVSVAVSCLSACVIVLPLPHLSYCVSVYMISWGRGFFYWQHLLSAVISVKEEAQSANSSSVYVLSGRGGNFTPGIIKWKR